MDSSNIGERDNIILDEVKKSYEREFDLKKNLENKATNVITISGLIVTLLFGFTTFLSQNSFHPQWFHYVTIFFSAGFAVIALGFSLWALKIRKYVYVSSENREEKDYLDDRISEYKTCGKDELISRLIDVYMIAIKINTWRNKRNAYHVLRSQMCLSIAISTIVVIIVAIAIPVIYDAIQSLL
jgi:uncharacterized membrane protein YbhN (UPF0104 family)